MADYLVVQHCVIFSSSVGEAYPSKAEQRVAQTSLGARLAPGGEVALAYWILCQLVPGNTVR
eukprot:1050448-Amphidinium_carterae.1